LKHSLLPIAPYFSDFCFLSVLFLFSLLFMNCLVKVLFYNAQYIVHIICVSVVTIVQNMYIYHKMSMENQSYAP